MIYATMCVGSKWTTKYQHIINAFSSKNHLEVLTDNTSFENCICHHYTREVFSYYEKINFIFNLSKKYNQRITYIDCDWLNAYNTNITYDDITLYSYDIFDLFIENPLTKFFGENEHHLRDTLLSHISLNESIKYYIPEALISLPKVNEIDKMISDIKTIQPILENNYNSKNRNPRYYRYVKAGIGYGEGWAPSAICQKYNIPIDKVDWKRKMLL
mgnify:CR=1 FL=1